MNQTKKRLSIIELAISITDIETIQIQIQKLDPLRSDAKLDEILVLLEDENYGHAQNLIQSYIVLPQETVMQRIQEEEPTSDEQAIFEEYDFLIEPTSDKTEDTDALPTDNTIDNSPSIVEVEDEIEEQEILDKVEKVPNDYNSLLEIQASDVLADNIQLNVSDKREPNFKKEKINFDLGTIPKDSFFDSPTTQKQTIENKISQIHHTDEFFQNDISACQVPENQTTELTDVNESSFSKTTFPTPILQTKETIYPAIPNIHAQFHDIQIQYPSTYTSQGYSNELETWLEKIANEGYTEYEVEEILKHIEELALIDKAQAAQFLLLTSKTASKYAKFILARALYRGSLLQRNLDESFKIMSHLAFDEKYPEAICDLAQFYENGISITKDTQQAELLYQEAISFGIQRAIPHYKRIQSKNKGFFSFLKR